ncbi:MAG: hypothetical protein KAH44_10960, partial [Oricola sp.]|nr:hypothetical protein [Oricola sp.]
MRLHTCPNCGAALSFESLACACGIEVAYDVDSDRFTPLGIGCANRQTIGCNWAADASGALCSSCATTEVIPDRFHDENRGLWAETEQAKRWVLSNLARWGWFVS